MKWAIVLILFSSYVNARYIANGFEFTRKDPPLIYVSDISLDRANKLFSDFQNEKKIPFGYPREGCYARAAAMAQIAEKQDIIVGKIFVEGLLTVEPKGKFQVLLWQYHVAPIVSVKHKNGKSELLVLDPSLFDRPITIKEWKNKMKFNKYQACDQSTKKCEPIIPRVDQSYYGSRFQYWPLMEKIENYKYLTKYDPSHIENMNSALKDHILFEDKSLRSTSTKDTSSIIIEEQK